MALLAGGKLRSQEGGQLAFWCPGCDIAHAVRLGPSGWSYNGSSEWPTFTPSVLVTTGHYLHGNTLGNCYCDFAQRHPKAAEGCTWKCQRCHSYVTDGRIQFLSDCSHALAGQTVDLPLFP